MKTIVVDDEKLMLSSFLRASRDIPDLEIAGTFQNPGDALHFAEKNAVELAFLDVKMPGMNGIELAKKLQEVRPDILIVFVSAYDEYIRASNQIGGDYYIVKPYKDSTLKLVMEKIRLLAQRQKKHIYIRTFGTFSVLKDGVPVRLTGKAKEILALVVTRRGKEISNQEIYRTLWEDRDCTNDSMTVYYNALHRLKTALTKAGISDLLLSTTRGQMADTALFDCDYYDWLDKGEDSKENFEGEFLSEYSWSEYLTGSLYEKLFE